MKFIEEHIRKLLGRETPPDLDADDLWAGIAAGLPEESDTPTGGILAARRNLALLIGILLLLTGITAAVWLNQPVTENSIILATDSPETSTLPTTNPAQKTNTTNDSELAVRDEAAQNLQNKSSNAALTRDSETQGNLLSAPISQSNGHNSTGQPAGTPTLASPASSDDESFGVSGTSSIQPVEVSGQSGKLNSADPERTTSIIAAGTLENRVVPSAISLLPVPAFASTSKPGLAEASPAAPPRRLPDATVQLPTFKSTAAPRLDFGLHAGGNLQIERFSGSTESVDSSLNRASGQAVGQSLSLDLRYSFTKHFALSLGAEYHRTINTFRHVIERDTMVPHPTPPNTGLIEAMVRHTVAHNNRRELISVPLLLVYQRRLGDFTLNFGAGLSANYQLSAIGRTLDAGGQFTRYTVPTTRQFFLAYQVQPAITWRLRPDSPWQLQLRTDVRYFNHGSNSLNSPGQKGWLIGGTIGVRRTL